MSIRSEVGRFKRAAGYGHLVSAGRNNTLPLVGYIGWTGEGNLGDEAMYQAHLAGLGFAATMIPLPVMADNLILRRFGPKLDALCLGGGTLIGNGYFRNGLEGVMASAPNAYRFMIGPGVESLDYVHGNRKDVESELLKWRPLLAEFGAVRVRGPLSAETLSTIGITTEVVGDPALALPSLQPERPSDDLVGINVGLTDDHWGDDAVRPEDLLVHLVDQVVALGYRVRLVPTTTEDYGFMRQLSATLAHPHEVPDHPLSLPATMQWMGECSALIGMKLHALVLALGQGVPIFALEYRPKCRDFMNSVSLQDCVMRLDELNWATLDGWLQSIDSDHVSEQSAADALGDRRTSLARIFAGEARQLTLRTR